jgi:hypothetical protein
VVVPWLSLLWYASYMGREEGLEEIVLIEMFSSFKTE